jgi:predicted transcriptional regulator
MEHLSDTDREKLYSRIKSEFHQQESEIVAYTTAGQPLTRAQYIERINIGLEQCRNGEFVTLEELQKEIDTW